ARWALQACRDAVYYPVVASLDGRNPYDQSAQARTYPVGQPFPPYLPLTLLAHLPFGLLPHAEAGDLYLAVLVGLTAVLAALAIARCGLAGTAGGGLRGPARRPRCRPRGTLTLCRVGSLAVAL